MVGREVSSPSLAQRRNRPSMPQKTTDDPPETWTVFSPFIDMEESS